MSIKGQRKLVHYGTANCFIWNRCHWRWRRYWILAKKTHDKLVEVTENNIILQQSQGAHFSHPSSEVSRMNSRLATLNEMVEALRATNPELDGALLAHNTITHLEQIGEIGNSLDEHGIFVEALDALEMLVSSISIESSVDDTDLLNQNTSNLILRLLETFDSHNMTADNMGLKPVTAHKLGHASLSLRRYDWAETCFGIAYSSSPGNSNILQALEHIAIEKGDQDVRRHWLEARMTVNPDDPELLRAHAHLLAKMGDMEAERDVRRLEALGLDTPADRSLLSGLRAERVPALRL